MRTSEEAQILSRVTSAVNRFFMVMNVLNTLRDSKGETFFEIYEIEDTKVKEIAEDLAEKYVFVDEKSFEKIQNTLEYFESYFEDEILKEIREAKINEQT